MIDPNQVSQYMHRLVAVGLEYSEAYEAATSLAQGHATLMRRTFVNCPEILRVINAIDQEVQQEFDSVLNDLLG